MFDKVEVHPTVVKHVPTTVNHHEHRAPTDDSVKLLKEMEAAAVTKLMDSGRLTDNLVSAEWAIFKDHLGFKLHVRINLMINGRRIELSDTWDIPLNLAEDSFEYRDALAKFIYDLISKEVAKEITLSVMIKGAKTGRWSSSDY